MPSSRLIRVVAASALLVSGIAFSSVTSPAQSLAAPQARITAPIDGASRFTLTGSHSTRAVAANDIGAVPASTKLTGMTFVFSRTPAQQTALDSLVAAQQNPASPLYHQWLTPAQFGAQFGAAASDIAAVESWLQQQGFTVDSVSNSRDRIHFSGTAALVESAFGAPLHYYRSGAETHFSPANDLTLPSALSSSVLAVTNLSDYRPHTHVRTVPLQSRPHFTVSGNQAYFLSPLDVETIYDISPAYNAGNNGAGQTIAVVGQSEVLLSDITNFQVALGITQKAPSLNLVPGTGAAVISSGDENESDIDLEYSGAIAPGATISLYYTGSNTNYGTLDALQYVVDNNFAPIISNSYGDCEFDTGSQFIAQFDTVLQQAAVQGETVISAAGDDGSTDCYEDSKLTFAQQTTLGVDYPASSVYVTGMGGTEFPAADVTPTNTTYWTSAGSSDVNSTAKSYIPEQVWNDDTVVFPYEAQNGETLLPSAGGGGTSLYETRPSWQAGPPGITSGNNRLVPDISLAASPNYPGYVYCSSDSAFTGITDASCVNGFRDASDSEIDIAGGTSFDAPIFAGLVAIINQAKGYNTGQGLVNPTLYSLASSTSTYTSAFHDITSGTNACNAGSTYCGTGADTTEYAATAGYDEATGLGSVNFFNLLTAWPTSTSSIAASTTTLSAATLSPAVSASDTITITIGYSNGTITPTGTVAITDNGTAVSGSPFTLANGAYTYTYSSAVPGAHAIVATYSGDSHYASSKGSISLNIGNTSFTLTATNPTITAGSSGTATVTIASSTGYTGTVNLSLSSLASFTNGCAVYPSSANVTGTSASTVTITFYTSITACNQAQSNARSGGKSYVAFGHSTTISSNHSMPPAKSPWKNAPLSAAFAGLLIAGCFRRRSRLLRGGLALGSLVLLSFSGFGLMGCSSSGSSTVNPLTSNDAPAGTYTFTVTGTDSVNSAITNSSSFTVTIQ